MKYVSVSSINRRISDPAGFVGIVEENYAAYVEDAALEVIGRGAPIVLISGPSGSGKTTTAMRIADSIAAKGHKAEVLSMDNYFHPIERFSDDTIPRDADGNVDLESPLRMDIQLFSEHLLKLAAGETIDMPLFDFPTQKRKGTMEMRRDEDEYMIIEGIHALNPMVTGEADKYCTCMYIALRTRIRLSDGSMIHPDLIRLMRRLCRDGKFRKREPEDVFRMFESVSRGEELYIRPYKHRSHYDIDTFMAYEASLYKPVIEQKLIDHRASLERFPEYEMIMRALAQLDPIDERFVPDNSLAREFVGGSTFDY